MVRISPVACEERRQPFRHWVLEDLTPRAELPTAINVLDNLHSESKAWVRYENDFESRKYTRSDIDFDGHVKAAFRLLQSPQMVAWLSDLTGVAGLCPDTTLHGAGVHVTDAGGFLSPHLDYAIHPLIPGMERRVNLIVFLSGDSVSGGEFALYDSMGENVINRVHPIRGRSVIWCPGDSEYHGTLPLSANAPPRVSLAAYYLAPVRGRRRALFVPNRGKAK